MLLFVLKDGKQKRTSVQVIVSGYFGIKNRVKLGIGTSIQSLLVLKESQSTLCIEKIRKSRHPDVISLKERMNIVEGLINSVIKEFNLKGEKPSRQEFKLRIQSVLNENSITNKSIVRSVLAKKHVFLDEFVEDYILSQESKTANYKSKSTETINKYKVALTHIKNFQEFNPRILIKEITPSLIFSLLDSINNIYIRKVSLPYNHINSNKRKRNSKGYSIQSITNFVRIFHVFIRKSINDGLLNSYNFDDEKFKFNKATSYKSYYLNESILKKVFEYKPKIKSEKLAKEYLILASCTGMRYQSVAKLHQLKLEIIKDNDEEFYAVPCVSNKTNTKLLCPAFSGVVNVYYENDNSFPKFPNLPVLNSYLKKLFTILGISNTIKVNEHIFGYGDVQSEVSLSRLISSHDARKSFITNLLNLDVNESVVKSMTHEKLSDGTAFTLYDKRTAKDRAIRFYKATNNLDSSIYTYKKGD